MPATGLSILCAINGIIIHMYRNTKHGMDAKTADMAITVAVETTTKAIVVGRAKVMATGMIKVNTETKQD